MICGCNSVVEYQLPKLAMWVRFPSPAPGDTSMAFYAVDVLFFQFSNLKLDS